MGNNEDLAKDGYIWYVPGRTGRFARINVGLEPDFAQGSLNEKGLAFDAAVVPEIPMEADRGRKADRLMEQVMDTCATVEEAIALMETVRFRHFARSQFFLADATGASAVVTWHRDADRLSVVRKEGAWQIATNCRMEDIGYREERHVLGGRAAEAAGGASAAAVQRVLEAMYGRMAAPEGYATIYDLRTLDVMVFNRYDFSRSKRFNLREAMAGEAWSHKMDDLFPGVTYDEREGIRPFDTRVALPEGALKVFAGRYQGPEGGVSEVRVGADGDLLLENSAGQIAHLYAEGPRQFRMREAPVVCTFDVGEDGAVTGLVVHIMEQRSRRAVRVE